MNEFRGGYPAGHAPGGLRPPPPPITRQGTTREVATRGTTNGNDRGSAASRRARRAWIMASYASDVAHCCRCYRCGVLLYNPDTPNVYWDMYPEIRALTIDRIIPGCQGGTYRRNNIRPACGPCNSETGGSTRRKAKT